MGKMRAGKVKKRLILDTKTSGVSTSASKMERVILPKLLDVVFDCLHLLAAGGDLEYLVLDFANAFWHLPLAVSERKWFVSRLRGYYFVFLRSAQGSRNAPLGWGRLAAMLGRMTQSVLGKNEGRLQVYTDDPCCVLRGQPSQRDRLISVITLLWRLMGFPLSWRKGKRGGTVLWIGGVFTISPDERKVTVRISQEIFEDSKLFVDEF